MIVLIPSSLQIQAFFWRLAELLSGKCITGQTKNYILFMCVYMYVCVCVLYDYGYVL